MGLKVSTHWRIDLLGGLRARSGDRVLSRFSTQKVGLLLAYLAYHRDRSHPRDALIDLLWPETDPRAGRNSLSVALSSLRHQLEPPGMLAGAVILADRVSVRLNPAAVTTDAGEFQAHLQAAERAGSRAERAADLESALALYGGELLPGCYDEWVLQERQWLAERYFGALSSLITHLEAAGDLPRALETARRGVRADPLREEARRELIRLLTTAGQPEAARHQYAELERLLRDELGTTPGEATRALVAALPEGATGRGPRGDLGSRCDRRQRRRSGIESGGAGKGDGAKRQDSSPRPGPPLRGGVSHSPDRPVPPLSPRRPVAPSALPTGTVSFLLTDIEGSTAHWERARDAFGSALAGHHETMRGLFRRHEGHEIKELGDGFLVAFERAGDALLCAIAAQRALAEQEWPADVGAVRVRMALHTGDVQPEEEDYHSPVLHCATRILMAGHGGQILCSETTTSLLRRSLEPGVRLKDLGVYRLRDVLQPERLFQIEAPEVAPREFPPLRAEAGHGGHLPQSFTRFFGREAEVEQLGKLLLAQERRLVTLMGPGGSGKTRLALEVGRQLADDWQGAIWFVPLTDLTEAGRLGETIRDAMRLPHAPRVEPLDQVVEALARQPALLVLDNFEQIVEEGASRVRALLERVPTLTCLVTSRQRLNISGEREFLVGPLPVPTNDERPTTNAVAEPLVVRRSSLVENPSVQLFVDRAQVVRPDFQVTERNAATIATLCQRLEGIPLALELAAARAQVLSPAQMLAHLSRRFDLLVSRQRDLAARHRTLRAAIDWSYELLSPELQRFFARLSVFRGGWDLAAAEVVCEEPMALDHLAQLRECSLVPTEEAPVLGEELRFRMLETVREYAHERLSVEERAELEWRHAAYFLDWAEEADAQLVGAEQAEWLERLEQEHDNLRAALDWSVAAGDGETGLRLGVAISRFWERRGHYAEGRERLTRALTLPAPDLRTAVRARALWAAGTLACDQGDFDTARTLNGESLALSRELADQRCTALALNSLAAIAVQQGDLRGGRALFEESLSIRRELGDKHELSASLNNVGVVAWNEGDFPASRAFHEESLALKRELGDKYGIAISLNSLAGLAAEQGDYRTARDLAEESLAMRHELGDRHGAAYALNSLGNITHDQGERDAARAFYEESQALLQELGDRWGLYNVLSNLGMIAAEFGEYDEAQALHQEVLVAKRELGDQMGASVALNNLGSLAWRRKEYAAARALLEEALAIRRELGNKAGIATSLHSLAILTRDEGDLSTARALHNQSLILRREIGNKTAIASCLEALATIAIAQGEPERAARLFGAATALRDAVGTPLPPAERADGERDQANACSALGEAAFAAAWAAGAATPLDEVIAFALG